MIAQDDSGSDEDYLDDRRESGMSVEVIVYRTQCICYQAQDEVLMRRNAVLSNVLLTPRHQTHATSRSRCWFTLQDGEPSHLRRRSLRRNSSSLSQVRCLQLLCGLQW